MNRNNLVCKIIKKARWIGYGFVGYVVALGGCVTDAQFNDFVRSEFARVPADTFFQLFLTIVQSINPFSVA